MSFWYLATPYSKYPSGIEEAHAEACRQSALLVRAGIPIYCPIAHTHPIAIHGDIDPFDHSIWLEADRTFMGAAKGLIVCRMEGWKSSYGIGVELQHFRSAGKPIIHMTPGLVPAGISSNPRNMAVVDAPQIRPAPLNSLSDRVAESMKPIQVNARGDMPPIEVSTSGDGN